MSQVRCLSPAPMRDSKRFEWILDYGKQPDEKLRERLAEVESAIRQNLPDAERFHFERELIRRLLKMK